VVTSAVQGDELANDVVIADLQTSRFARVLEILGRRADRAVALETVAGADHGAAAKAAERSNLAVGADHNIGFDDVERPDHDPFSKPGPGIDDGCRMDRAGHQRSASADIISASHTTTPSTSARPRILANVLRLATTSTSKTS